MTRMEDLPSLVDLAALNGIPFDVVVPSKVWSEAEDE